MKRREFRGRQVGMRREGEKETVNGKRDWQQNNRPFSKCIHKKICIFMNHRQKY